MDRLAVRKLCTEIVAIHFNATDPSDIPCAERMQLGVQHLNGKAAGLLCAVGTGARRRDGTSAPRHTEHRAGCRTHELRGNAPQHHATEEAVAMRRRNHQIGGDGIEVLHQSVRGMAMQ